MHKLDPTRGQSISVGKKLTKMCRILEVEFEDKEGANEYPYWLLKALFDTVEKFEINFAELVYDYLEFLENQQN